MSEVKRYNVIADKHGDGTVEESEAGSVVFYEDYAALKERFDFKANLTEQIVELQKQRDALAAENGLAAKAVQTFCDVVGSNTDVIAEEMGMDGVKAILAAMSATGNMPATTAYLNSVRAAAVQELADAWYAIANETSEGVSISDSTRLKYCQRADDAADFAAHLRAGKDGE